MCDPLGSASIRYSAIHKTRLRFSHLLIQAMLIGFIALASPFCFARTIPKPTITGWTKGALVINAQWTGQPDRAPNHGKYFHFYAIDSDPSMGSHWVFNGSGFGTKPGD